MTSQFLKRWTFALDLGPQQPQRHHMKTDQLQIPKGTPLQTHILPRFTFAPPILYLYKLAWNPCRTSVVWCSNMYFFMWCPINAFKNIFKMSIIYTPIIIKASQRSWRKKKKRRKKNCIDVFGLNSKRQSLSRNWGKTLPSKHGWNDFGKSFSK